jgi:glycosyltransferase involved in cell wall biosynthesis
MRHQAGSAPVCLLHGYLLEGSGSNLWTRSIIRSLCRQGETVHLMAQENHPEAYDFIAQARRYLPGGEIQRSFDRDVPYEGRCVFHKPLLGDTLPVYVWDEYEEFSRVVPMVELPDAEIEAYLELNVAALLRIVESEQIAAIHANHAVLMSVVAQRVSAATGIPFAIMPHGSAIEYAVKRDERFHRLASEAFEAARCIFVIGDEMRQRVTSVFPTLRNLEKKLVELRLGVDTTLFSPVPRSARKHTIRKLAETLRGESRGRNPDQTETLRAAVRQSVSHDSLRGVIAESRRYDPKLPDADVERKLDAIDWEADSIVLFVGRLLAAKGVQDVVAAVPLLIPAVPNLRLIIVGHGPLREPLEALLAAFEQGDRRLVEEIVASGGGPGKSTASPTESDNPGDETDRGGAHTGHELTKVKLFHDALGRRGQLDNYFAAAREHLRPERVIFTGYLTHDRLRFLFPCCDVAVFPSAVREAGPLVFLEALAAGVFPLGTYFGGMRASIDSIAEAFPSGEIGSMRLSPADDQTVEDIVTRVPVALELAAHHRDVLRRIAEERYDWQSVARKLVTELRSLASVKRGPTATAGLDR